MEFSAAPILDTEPFPQYYDPADSKEASSRHFVLHCKHNTCQDILHRAKRRFKTCKRDMRFSCVCKSSSLSSNPAFRTCPAFEIKLDDDVTAEECVAFGVLDWDKEIVIRYCDSVHFLGELEKCDSISRKALRRTYAFTKKGLPVREQMIATCESHLLNAIHGYLTTTLTPLPQQSRRISPRMLRVGLANHLRLVLWDWQHAHGSLRRGPIRQFTPVRFREMVVYDGIAREVWKAWGRVVNDLIRLYVLRDMRAHGN